MVFGAVLVPSPTSPMWWMGVFYGVYLCVLLVEVWSMFTDHPKIHQAACTMAACTAIVAPATLGAVFGVLVARPFWHGPFTPILMVASAFLSGTALLGIVFYAVHRLRLEGAERAASLAIPAIRLAADDRARPRLAPRRPAGDRRARAAIDPPSSRRHRRSSPARWPSSSGACGWSSAWSCRCCSWPCRRPGRSPAPSSAASLAFVGVFTDRMTFVSAGQIAPTSASGVVAAPWATYSPTLVEIAILIGAAAFVALGYTLAERYLDLRESIGRARLRLAVMDPRPLPPPEPRGGRPMIHHPVARYGYPITVVLLLTAILFVGGFVLATVVPELARAGRHWIGHADRHARHRALRRTATSPMAFAPNRIADVAGRRLRGLPPGHGRGGHHEADPDARPSARGLEGLHGLSRRRPPRQDRPRPFGHPQVRLPRLPQGPEPPRDRPRRDRTTSPRAPRASPATGPRRRSRRTWSGRTNCWICHSGTEFEDLFDGPAATLPPLPGRHA